MTAMTPEDALAAVLAGEHAAVYVYGVLGGRVSQSAQPALADDLRAAYTTHRARRDEVTAMLREAGAEPPPAAVSYALPNPARTPAQLRAAGRELERASARAYAAAVGRTAQAQRQWAVDALQDAAVRGLAFGDRPAAWPGAPEL